MRNSERSSPGELLIRARLMPCGHQICLVTTLSNTTRFSILVFGILLRWRFQNICCQWLSTLIIENYFFLLQLTVVSTFFIALWERELFISIVLRKTLGYLTSLKVSNFILFALFFKMKTFILNEVLCGRYLFLLCQPCMECLLYVITDVNRTFHSGITHRFLVCSCTNYLTGLGLLNL